MSTIVVARKGNQVCIAADSLTTIGNVKLGAGYDKYYDKIQRCGDAYVGIVGSAAHSLVIEDIFKQENIEYDFKSRQGIFRTFLSLHTVLKDKYFLVPNAKTGSDEEDPYETSHIDAVIANEQGIFAVYSLRDANEFERFWAIGSGADFAIGAMHACYEQYDSAEEIAKAGIMAGTEFDNASALPMTCQVINLKSE